MHQVEGTNYSNHYAADMVQTGRLLVAKRCINRFLDKPWNCQLAGRHAHSTAKQ
jgi:hypothetical protein